MRVDFYQLSRDPAERVLPLLARNSLKAGERLLVVSGDEAQLDSIGEALWQTGDSFLANGRAGSPHDARQPILLSDRTSLPTAPAIWPSPTASGATRSLVSNAFSICSAISTLQAARDCWRMLGERDGVERRFWKQDGGKWVEGP